jgi:arylsulfatase A-like enzyme
MLVQSGSRSLALAVTRALSFSLALFASLTAAGCGSSRPEGLVIVVVDTLRVNHLGCYGHERETSPALDSFAAGAARFDRAYASSSWTQPSVASMFTGLYPSSHTVFRIERRLPDRAETLAEILGQAGYATAAVISHTLISSDTNFDQGFQTFHDDHARGYFYRSTPGVTAQAVSLLERFAEDDRPFFLFVHYFDPHYNYRRHSEFGFAPNRAGRLTGGESIKKLRALSDPTPEEIDLVKRLYDEEVRFTDRGFGELLEALDQLGLRQSTTVIFTADHGEEFFDRGWIGHTRTLYEEIIRVPLLVRTPDGATGGEVIRDQVSLVGLVPTVLDLLHIDAGGREFHSPSFASVLRGDDGYSPGPIFTEVDFADRPPDPEYGDWLSKKVRKRALIQGDFKLVEDLFTGQTELYRLDRDPREQNNLVAVQPEVVESMAPELAAIAERAEADSLSVKERVISDEELEALKKLGYVDQ